MTKVYITPQNRMQMTMSRKCIDCKHIIKPKYSFTKHECKKYYSIDLITGEKTFENAYSVRDDAQKCGPKGIEFEEKSKWEIIVQGTQEYIKSYLFFIIIYLFSLILILIRIKDMI